ncbi:MAG: hypothetical protein KAJ18_06070 [Candidatus Omnitrophica bacterium]|nr:hypothetical protein [Candidatus Omnitrophota bacterium]
MKKLSYLVVFALCSRMVFPSFVAANPHTRSIPAHVGFITTSQSKGRSVPLGARISAEPAPKPFDEKLIRWIQANVSKETNMPLSFYIPAQKRDQIFQEMGHADSVPSIIERVIVDEGLIVYDGAVGQIVLSLLGGNDNFALAAHPLKVYWDGQLGDLFNIRAGYPMNSFIYDPDDPYAVSSDLNDKGKRGFIFRIINANGRYNTSDPLDGKTHFDGFPTWPTVHWEDWKPVAGENAWVVMAALHLYHQKYYDPYRKMYPATGQTVELLLAEEIARAALLLQAENGGIRMAPIGTFRNPTDFQDSSLKQGEWWYNQISSENNISWYGAFGMLYEITQNSIYKDAMQGIEEYFKSVWDENENYFYQGLNFCNGQWMANNEHFALDVQTWGLAAFGPEKFDEWFGEGTAYRVWKNAKQLSGVYDSGKNLVGVGYIREHDRVSVEWTAGAILAARLVGDHYRHDHPRWADESYADADTMRQGIEFLRTDLGEDRAAYSYSSRRGWIPFGWNSHSPEVLSLASTGWVIFVDTGFNPFYLESRNNAKHYAKQR